MGKRLLYFYGRDKLEDNQGVVSKNERKGKQKTSRA